MQSLVPGSEFFGTIRHVNLDALSPAARKVFDYAFPLFNETPTLNPGSRAAVERGESVENPYNYRRFAGGWELLPGCYSTVCVDETGRDNGTLVHELTFYAEPQETGEMYVYDGHDPQVTGEDSGLLGTFTLYRPDPSSIVAAFVSRPNQPHPLLDPNASPPFDNEALASFLRSAPRSDRGVILLEIPTTVRQVHRQDVVDLRQPAHQDWLNERARFTLPFTAFVYSEPFDGLIPLDLDSFRPSDYIWNYEYKPPGHTADYKRSPDAPASRVLYLGAVDGGPFLYLLRALLYRGRGGSPITEAIGTMLRTEGAQGLIYPSTRNNVFCESEGDDVLRHSGWCFVDYSAFPMVQEVYRTIIDPEVWCRKECDIRIVSGGDRYASLEILAQAAWTQARHRQRVEDWYSKT